MALSHEDKKDVAGAMGKAVANKIAKVTNDKKMRPSLRNWLNQDKKSAPPDRMPGVFALGDTRNPHSKR